MTCRSLSESLPQGCLCTNDKQCCNNAAERGIRTFAQGKHNWYLIDTERGARASAIAYGIAETARANDLKQYEYFKYLLEELPKHGEFADPTYLDDLLPWSEKLPAACRKTKK